jgi:hypothetical protein
VSEKVIGAKSKQTTKDSKKRITQSTLLIKAEFGSDSVELIVDRKRQELERRRVVHYKNATMSPRKSIDLEK